MYLRQGQQRERLHILWALAIFGACLIVAIAAQGLR
jgi:hypothetical protein